jgi:cytochrome b subunit of formate dehydrogenase
MYRMPPASGGGLRRSVIKRFLPLILFFPALLAYGQSVEDCQQCHADKDLSKSINDSTELSLFIHQGKFEKSVHGGFSCVDCHSTVKSVEHESDLPAVDCSSCHEEAQKEYAQSIHAISLDGEKIVPARCRDCHGSHYILPAGDPESTIYPPTMSATCGKCHTDPAVIEFLGYQGVGPVAGYQQSVHARILREDPARGAPTCTNCHGAHNIFIMSDPRSSFNKLNRAETCGGCHSLVKEEYLQSIHWRAVQRGHFESPTCNDCHGEHRIQSPQEKDAITNRLNLSSQICAKCHSSQTMMARFGLDAERFASYNRTYHGLAILKGSPDAANCTSCHEIHAIREQNSPESSINPAHLQETCGKCHQNINKEFISIAVHPKNLVERNPVAFYARSIYLWLIVVLIGGMIVHNMFILTNYIRKKRHARKQDRLYQRFQPFEVYQHMILIFSFFLLVITGFALKFPEAGWVRLLVSAGMDEPVRSLLHRIGAVILITSSVIQLGYFIFHRKGRREIVSLRPQIADLTDFWQNMKYYLGFSVQRPVFGRWDYTEKAEYLALIWGTAIMAFTGLVLWFPEFFMRYLPSWMFETSEVIHYFEAWLATLAILVWHWFFVIYHPERYPMNLTWMDGKISEEEMRHHHPGEYKEVQKHLKE